MHDCHPSGLHGHHVERGLPTALPPDLQEYKHGGFRGALGRTVVPGRTIARRQTSDYLGAKARSDV
eukprot:13708216-Alexandrium_andersonii.AAC.1